MPPVKSTRRERQAAETRREILDAAGRLFGERGYAATSIGDIAKEAGVAVQTIYSSVGSKSALLVGLLDHLDDVAGVRAFGEFMQTEPAPQEAIRRAVQLSRSFRDRAGGLLRTLAAAAAVDPKLAEVLEGGRRRHQGGARRLVAWLDERGALREGMTAERGTAIYSTLTWTPLWLELHDDHGWSFDAIEDWMVETLVAQLLDA